MNHNSHQVEQSPPPVGVAAAAALFYANRANKSAELQANSAIDQEMDMMNVANQLQSYEHLLELSTQLSAFSELAHHEEICADSADSEQAASQLANGNSSSPSSFSSNWSLCSARAPSPPAPTSTTNGIYANPLRHAGQVPGRAVHSAGKSSLAIWRMRQ